MKRAVSGFLSMLILSTAFAQTPVECKGGETAPYAYLWPTIYISKDNMKLCFNVQSWMNYKGNNCVSNGGTIEWRGIVIVSIGGESQGRDDTHFRVKDAVFTDEQIRYVIEWSRQDAVWHPMQHIEINRMTGEGVSYSMTDHGGDAIVCQRNTKKI